MSEDSSVVDDLRTNTSGDTAGQTMRAAREKRGLHIAALAASLKVPQRKLEALEADRYNELPDLAFTRALSQSVCRTLKIDPQPVLALLPATPDTQRLAQVANGIQAPFSDTAHAFKLGPWLRNPALWATVLIAVGAGALAFAPERFMDSVRHQFNIWTGQAGSSVESITAAPGSAGPANTVSEPANTPQVTAPAITVPTPAAASAAVPVATVPTAQTTAVVETVHSAPPPAVAGAAADVPAGLLTLRASSASWVDVQDARGQSLLSRTLQAGETVGLDGALPLRVKVGNAAGIEVYFRGQAVDLTSATRDNTARLQLK
jgi:cytoskeleton protein RodZ